MAIRDILIAQNQADRLELQRQAAEDQRAERKLRNMLNVISEKIDTARVYGQNVGSMTSLDEVNATIKKQQAQKTGYAPADDRIDAEINKSELQANKIIFTEELTNKAMNLLPKMESEGAVDVINNMTNTLINSQEQLTNQGRVRIQEYIDNADNRLKTIEYLKQFGDDRTTPGIETNFTTKAEKNYFQTVIEPTLNVANRTQDYAKVAELLSKMPAKSQEIKDDLREQRKTQLTALTKANEEALKENFEKALNRNYGNVDQLLTENIRAINNRFDGPTKSPLKDEAFRLEDMGGKGEAFRFSLDPDVAIGLIEGNIDRVMDHLNLPATLTANDGRPATDVERIKDANLWIKANVYDPETNTFNKDVIRRTRRSDYRN